MTDVSASAAKSFAKVEEAIGELERKLGPRTADWTYHDADGKPIGVVCRWDKVDGKKYFQPVSLYGGAWFIKGLPAPRPLYRLPELKGAKRVYICEGEKAAEAARAIGLVATTSVHGAKSAKETDWSPLAGLDVAFFPDNDSSGWEFAEEVAEILGKMDPATTIRIVELPGLPEKGDIVEWIAAQGTSDPVELLRRIEQLVAQTDPLPAKVTESTYFTPFPTHILPEPLSTFVSAGAKAIGCDPTYIALPLLVVLAAAIGNTRRLRLKNSWTVPSILWATIVGESGSSKSPAFGLVMRPIKARQETAFREHAAAMQAYEADLVLYEMDKAAWVRGKVVGEPPTPPIAPVATRFYVGDTTIEAIAPLLLENPRGLLLARDELAGWLGSFDRYSSGKGGDASTWLSMQLGEGITVDRKSGKPRTIYVPQACVSICGGIQPGILHRALGTEHRESGLAARLLLCCPPRMPKQWTESDVDPELEVEFGRLLDRLYQLQPRIDEQGNPQAEIVTLTPAAKQAWTAYYDLHARELADLVGDLAAAWSKLEEYAARLA
ncbi:MAG: DUF3987 domain-containing protein, partial [Planctomycetota bacterium]|nr:DUF3987 domain-containing protein [Planctomycetota bacterium]